MTGLEKIVQQIRDEAQQAADAVIAQAKEEAGQLAAKAAEDARTQSGAILAKSKTDVQNHLAAARSAAELAQRRAVLAAKQEIIGEAIESARQSIYKLPRFRLFRADPQDDQQVFSPAGGRDALLPRRPRAAARQLRDLAREIREREAHRLAARPATSTAASCSATAASRRTARSRRSSTRRASDLQDRVQELLFS